MTRYRRRGKPLYSVRHLSTLNLNFRTSWDTGIDQALTRVEQLKSQGWIVDTERGTLTEKQADSYSQIAEKTGHDTVRILVAKWGEDMIQFVAYKPRLGEDAKPPLIIPPQPRPRQTRITRDPVMEFQKMFWRKLKQTREAEPDGGVLISPDRSMAIVAANANPVHNQSLKDVAKDIMANAEIRQGLDYRSLLNAEKDPKQEYRYVKFGANEFSIRKIKEAMRVLGKKGSSANHSSKQGVLAVSNPNGDIVLIAPATTTDQSEVITHA
jgi:hypothetical protein